MSYKLADVIWNDDGTMVDLGNSNGKFDTIYININNWNELSKKLKVLEIIKEHCEFICNDDTRTVIIARNGIMIPICHWAGETYDLLKEVLL